MPQFEKSPQMTTYCAQPLPRLHNSQTFAYNGNMDVLTAAEMRQCDERTVEQGHAPGRL